MGKDNEIPDTRLPKKNKDHKRVGENAMGEKDGWRYS